MAQLTGCVARLSVAPLRSFPHVRHETFLSSSLLFASCSPNKRTTPPVYVTRAKRVSSRTGKFEKAKNLTTTTITEEEGEGKQLPEGAVLPGDEVANVDSVIDMPVLPGEKQDFWEGEKWDGFGFFAQYMWAFGIVFALIACVIAVATYNEGATDFKDTPVYKESVKSRELLEEPDASGSDVFEANPTEEAPSLE
ncbi:hypothetical protein EJ110_NYTH08441 [Nymphaea thermarum]|nr:hypothetical protein EJ110_NYTH08441 [Nymphaea thermarum]